MNEGEAQNQERFDEWALIELFGHQQIAGRVTEHQIGGASFVRVDVFQGKGKQPRLTKFYNPSAIYSISPMSEATARAAATHMSVDPIQRYDIAELIRRKALTLPGMREDDEA